jgi:hypothetical protein
VNDRDRSDYLGGPYGDCADCGQATDSSLCEECRDRRDAHTDALELRMMVKAVLRSDLTKVKDVA